MLGTLFVVIGALKGTLGGGEQIILDLSIVFMGQHGTVVNVQQGGDDDHHQRQDAVVVEGDLAQEHADTGAGEAVGYVGCNGSGPRGHGSQHTNGSGGGIDDVSQLGTGDLVALRHGTHHGAHGQAVEIVVDEDQHAQQHGQQLRTGAGLHGLLGPAAEGSGTAGLVHQVHHDAQDDQEDQDGDVDGVDHADALTGADEIHDHLPGLEVGQQQGTYHAAQEQGRVHFLTDEGQRNSHDGGEQRPTGGYEAGTVIGHLGDDQCDHNDRQRNKIRYTSAFLFH